MSISMGATEMIEGQAINLGIAIVVGFGVGMFQDVPIDMVPDAANLRAGDRIGGSGDSSGQWSGRPGGTYSKEMEDFTNRMLGVVNSKSFWIGGILAILFVVGMVPLLLSSRDLEFGSIIMDTMRCHHTHLGD